MMLIRHLKEKPNLYELVDAFRHHRAKMSVRRDGASHGAFAMTGGATLQSQSEATPATSEKKKDDCICGGKHRFKKCPYPLESAQPDDWTADPAVTEKVAQKLKDHSKLETAVKHHCDKDAIPFKKAEAAELTVGENEDEEETAGIS
jgi:hypothetical protein